VFADLEAPRAERVYVGGELVAREGRPLWESGVTSYTEATSTVHVDWDAVDLAISARGQRVRTIGVIPEQIVTEHLVFDARVEDRLAVADPARDLLKMAVIERHGRSGTVGLGFVHGLGLTRGAIASTVAHDHHNLVVIGADDRSMHTAARAIAATGGGQCAAVGDEVLGLLALPIAGLMSDFAIEEVRDHMVDLLDAARGLGTPLHDPFMAMSFLALEVIPSLKLTDQGLVDVERFAPVSLFEDA
jgi:adenine deaminase